MRLLHGNLYTYTMFVYTMYQNGKSFLFELILNKREPYTRKLKKVFNFVELLYVFNFATLFFRENCEPATAKSIRKFYRRPYFLPPMAEAATENWIFAAYGGENNETKMQWEYVRYYVKLETH